MNNLTQEQVSKLSDLELDLEIAKLLYPNQPDGWYNAFMRSGNGDYCNNWNDLMPLIVEHGIDLGFLACSRVYAARLYDDVDVFSLNENPKRALAECLFLALQEKAK